MNYRHLIFGMLVSLIVSTPATAEARNGSWGYIHHASALSNEYLEKALPLYEVICLTGFRITDDGRITTDGDAMFKRISPVIKKNKTTLYPVISFRSAAQGHQILNSPERMSKAARSMAALAGEYGFPGIHLDFEYLASADARKLYEFLGLLREIYKGTISMALFPQVEFPAKWSGFHDLKLLAARLDAIVLMCYDLHASHTGPGPVTSPAWAEKNIVHALRHMGPDRIWLGIPAYGYRWSGGKATPLSSSQCARLARLYGATRDDSGNKRIVYTQSGKTFHVYYSDRETRLLLEELAGRYNLAGTALWRIGFED